MKEDVKVKLKNIGIPKIANYLGVSGRAVYKWIDKQVPPGRVISICILSEWAITPHELRPDIHPNPTDGMPSA